MLAHLSRVGLILALIVASVWLLAAESQPAAEGLARQQALRMLSSVGNTGAALNAEPIPETEVVSATVIDLAGIPAGVYDPNNQRDRWLRGEIDLDEAEGLLPPAEIERLKQAALNLAPVDIDRLAAGPDLLTPPLGESFAITPRAVAVGPTSRLTRNWPWGRTTSLPWSTSPLRSITRAVIAWLGQRPLPASSTR